jgi:hypothetical protein
MTDVQLPSNTEQLRLEFDPILGWRVTRGNDALTRWCRHMDSALEAAAVMLKVSLVIDLVPHAD